MGKQTGISWCDHTFNPWWGCTRVSEGCMHCYAETFSKWLGFDIWGKGKAHRFFGDKHWAEPEKWNEAAAYGKGRKRVFCASMADVFEDAPGLLAERRKLWDLIEQTPSLEWLLLTKRPENLWMLPKDWRKSPIPNVRVGITIESQAVAWQRLANLTENWRGKNFLSVEPMLGPVSITKVMAPGEWDWNEVNSLEDQISEHEPEEYIEECEAECDWVNCGDDLVVNPDWLEWRRWRINRAKLFAMGRLIDWVIIGGESGAGCRPMDPQWALDLLEECTIAKVPVFMKQMGGHPNKLDKMVDFPEKLQVREFPKEER